MIESRSDGYDASINLRLSDSNMADHGVTNIAGTDTFFQIVRTSNSYGGANIYGLSGEASTPGLRFTGVIGVTNPTDTQAAVEFFGSRKNGADNYYMGDAETVVTFWNYGRRILDQYGNGDLWVLGKTTTTGARIGDSTNYLDVSTTGFTTLAGSAKSKLSMRPQLYAGRVGGVSKPTFVTLGANAGYSSPSTHQTMKRCSLEKSCPADGTGHQI